jgi:putative addiction module component (TIGR02574 family)
MSGVDLVAARTLTSACSGQHLALLGAAAEAGVRPSEKSCGEAIDMGGSGMLSNTLATLLKLPAKDRIELAMALWESLADEEREAELVLTPEQEAELDRRLNEHLANPGSAIPWEEVRRKLASGA